MDGRMILLRRCRWLCLVISLVTSNFCYSATEGNQLAQSYSQRSEDIKIAKETKGKITSYDNASMTIFIGNNRKDYLKKRKSITFDEKTRFKWEKLITNNQLEALLKEVWQVEVTPLLKTWMKIQVIEYGNTFLCFELTSIFMDEFKQASSQKEGIEERWLNVLVFYKLASVLASMDSVCISDPSVADVPEMLSMVYFSSESIPEFSKDQEEAILKGLKENLKSYLLELGANLENYPSPHWIQQQSIEVFLGILPQMLSKQEQLNARKNVLAEILGSLKQ
jgi:hypothetical protein